MLASLRSIRYYGQRFINKHIRFLHLHYLYIALIIFIFSGLYYCQQGTSWAYIDALYMATTGCTNTGINTIPISLMSTFQVSVLYFSSFFGSHIVISLVVVMVRKHYFSKRFHEVVLFNKARKLRERQRWRQSTSNSWPNITRMQSAGNVSSYYNRQDNEHTHSRLHDIAVPSNASPVDAFSCKTRQETQHDQHLPQPPSELSIPIDTISGDDLPTPTQLEKEKPPTTAPQLEHANIGPRTASRTSLFSSTPMNGGMNIIFAENVQQQREDARQRLQEQRKMEVEGQDMGYRQRTDYYQHYPDNTIGDGDSIGTHEYVDVLSLAQDQTELTREQRYLVGGAEYRALDLLTTVIPVYYLVIVLGSSFAFRVYIAVSPYAQNVLLTSNGNNIPVNPWYFSFFICLSAMNNLGLSHLDNSMIPFQNAPFPLLICSFLVLAGNTAYPIFLRFVLWCMYHVTPRSCNMHGETLRYLLDHPRRCYTTLFPSLQTWWLLVSLLVINLTEVIVYTSTNFWLPVMDGIPVASQVMDGLFQAIATRNAGFSVVNLASLNPGTILVYIVAMYISVYPVAISMRNSNVYQERSLGMYRIKNDLPYMDNYDDDGDTTGGGIILKLRKQKTINSVMTASKKIFSRPDFFVMTQIQRQLTRDICWVMAGIFCICVLEARSMMSPSSVTFMSVVYECVSAFGCVGGSLGGSVPGTSQSVDYRTVSKLVLIILMYRGRHRGLPASIDRSVLLPSEQLERSDTQEQQQRLNGITTATGSGIIGRNIGVVYHRSETV